MFLSNSSIDENQSVSLKSAAAPSDRDLTSKPSNDEFLRSITYHSLRSVVRQCDKGHLATSNKADEIYLQESSAGTNNGHYGRIHEDNSKPDY